jgi:chemotaxis protein CheX
MANIFDASTYQSEIRQIVSDVFHSMLRCEAHPAPEGPASSSHVTAVVFLAGSWQGAALLECGQKEAAAFASRLMPIAPAEITPDDVRDAMGEIVNMIGGNLKSILPHGVGLSLPSVVEGSNYAYNICGNNRRETLRFETNVGGFSVTLVQTSNP